MFCKNCGKELPDAAKFCGACGTPVAPAVPEDVLGGQPEAQESTVTAETPVPEAEAAAETPVPETEAAAAPVPEAEAAVEAPVSKAGAAVAEAPVPEAGAAEEVPAPVKRRGKGGLIVLGGIAVAVILVVVLAVKLVGGLLGGGGGSRAQAFAYLTDDNELMYLSDLKEDTKGIEVSDKNYPGRVQFTKDGKTLYFQDSDNTLYKIAVSELKKDGRPERVTRDVIRYNVLDDGMLVYGKWDSDGAYEVTCATDKDSFRLVKKCDSYYMGEDQKSLYYTKYDRDDGTYTLYKIALKEDAQEEELLDGYSTLYTDWDADLLVYGENNADPNAPWSEDTDYNTWTIYSCKPGGEATELVDDVYSIYGVKTDGDKVSLYYTVRNVEKYTLYDLVTDSKAGEDAATLATPLSYPDWSYDYYPYGLSDDGLYYTTYSGNRFPISPSGDIWENAYNDAQERYNKDLGEYETKRDAYYAAENRDYIRKDLQSSETRLYSLSLYHYTGSADSDPIATGVDQGYWSYAAEDGVFLYKKVASPDGGKVGDVSDEDIYDKIYSGRSSSDGDWYQNVGGAESVIDFDEDVSDVYGVYVLNGKEVVLNLSYLAGSQDNRRTERILNAYTMGGAALTFSSTLAEDDFDVVKADTDGDNDTLYFFTEVESEDYGYLGDLNKYSGGGKAEVVVKEIYGILMLDNSDTLYAVTDLDRKGAELSLLQGDKPTVISSKMDGSIIICLDAKQLLFTEDGNLYLWDGKEKRRVARDVSAVWANSQESYSLLTPYGYGDYDYGYGDYDYGYGDYDYGYNDYNYGGADVSMPSVAGGW